MRRSLKAKAEEEKVKRDESDYESDGEDANPPTKKRKSRGKVGGPRSKRREGDSNDESEKDSIDEEETASAKKNKNVSKGRRSAANNDVESEKESLDEEEPASAKKKNVSKGRRSAADNDVDSEKGSVEEEEPASAKKNKNVSKGRRSAANNNDVDSENGSDDELEPASSKKNKRVSKGKRSAANDSDVEENDESGSDREQVLLSKKMKAVKKTPAKNGLSKARKRAAELEEKLEYEVESVVGFRVQRGKRQYRVHWKGFKDEEDTWENEDGLDCKEAIEEYLKANPESDEQTDKKTKKKDEKAKVKKEEDSSQDEDDGAEYEVERIVDVFIKKNGKREFLIRWKGYGTNDDTWEPEENLNCADLIKKYEEKIDKAKSVSAKELRLSRKPTDRFTLTMTSQGRRLSRRGGGKQRKRYDDTE